MMFVLELFILFVSACLFVVTQGTAFKERFQSSKILHFLVAIIAIAAFVFLVRDLIAFYPNNQDKEPAVASPDSAEDLLQRGLQEAALGNHHSAISRFDAAFAIEPDYAEIVVARGRSFTALGRFDRAISDFDRALRIRPNYPEASRYRIEAIDGKTSRLLEPLWKDIAQRR